MMCVGSTATNEVLQGEEEELCVESKNGNTAFLLQSQRTHIWEINREREWVQAKGVFVPVCPSCGASFRASMHIALTSPRESVCT